MCEIYREKTLLEVPRILGFIDKNEGSETFGCADRYYWHYKFHDYANARFQEVAYLLALLFKNEFPQDPFFKNEKVLQWAFAAVKFWLGMRNSDGSVNEAYPFERSFCATALGCYAVTEALLILGAYDTADSLKKTGLWLARNNNPQVSNQTIGAAASLYNIYILTKDRFFKDAAHAKLSALIKSQDRNGFFPEYGAVDIGYQTLTLSLLCAYYKKSADPAALDSIKKGVLAVEGVIDENGAFDYSLTSRKTQFLYPYGFACSKNSVIERHINGLKAGCILEPGWLDDRYVIPLATDYLKYYLEGLHVHDNG
jgi:hypothetical protein